MALTLLSREALLAAPDIDTEVVEVSEWGGSVTIQTMTVEQRDAMLKYGRSADGKMDTTALTVGMLVYGLKEPKLTADDAQALRQKSSKVVERVVKQIMAFNGMTEEGAKKTEDTFLAVT